MINKTRKDSPAWQIIQLQTAKINGLQEILRQSGRLLYMVKNIKGNLEPEAINQVRQMEAKIRRTLEKK